MCTKGFCWALLRGRGELTSELSEYSVTWVRVRVRVRVGVRVRVPVRVRVRVRVGVRVGVRVPVRVGVRVRPLVRKRATVASLRRNKVDRGKTRVCHFGPNREYCKNEAAAPNKILCFTL